MVFSQNAADVVEDARLWNLASIYLSRQDDPVSAQRCLTEAQRCLNASLQCLDAAHMQLYGDDEVAVERACA
jgi:hypothetical protein